MNGIYLQKNSPYYWLRYYDKLEPDPQKRRKSLNTKIPVTKSDLSRKNNGQKILGSPEVRQLARELKMGLAKSFIENKAGVKLKKKIKVSEGYEEFKETRSVPGSKKFLKKKTIINYDKAVKHFITCCTDKYIHKCTESDYVKLLHYFDEYKIPGRTKRDKKNKIVSREYKSMSINSRSIYTRTLHSLWNFFVEQNYANQNIIESIQPEEKDPDPILFEDMRTIINYLKDDKEYPHHYWIICFMLLTGCRPSSAIVQLKEKIDFKRKYISIQNVKTGARKGKQDYKFPLYNELYKLLTEEMGVKPGDKGRLFDMYKVVPENYTWSLSFWDRKINLLLKAKLIERKYTLKQIRPTFTSFLINVLGVDIYVVYKLADHANIKVTDKHYIDFNVSRARKELDVITLDSFLDE